MSDGLSSKERLLELLADQALFGLSDEDHRVLTQLSEQHPEVEAESMDRLAAMVELASLPAEVESLPADLQARIQSEISDFSNSADAMLRDAPDEVGTELPSQDRNSVWQQVALWGGWVIAAGLLVAALSSSADKSDSGSPGSVIVAKVARETLMNESTNLMKADWTANGDEAALDGSGDVVWNNAKQEGYMRFKGLASNDPDDHQYQLWIFDSEQDEKYPIDGGVFDVPPGETEVVIPIRAKIKVANPTMFAITVEKPGGVVVSSRDRLPLLAKLSN